MAFNRKGEQDLYLRSSDGMHMKCTPTRGTGMCTHTNTCMTEMQATNGGVEVLNWSKDLIASNALRWRLGGHGISLLAGPYGHVQLL